MSQEEDAVEMRKITKELGMFKVNGQIDLQVKLGEVYTLLGESGVGKSTSMDVLSGLLEPTPSEIYMNDEKVNITDPIAANRLGVGMVHQYSTLVKAFTVTENIILDSEPTRGGILDRKKARKEIEETSKQCGLNINPNAYIHDISVNMQQRVEILKTLYRSVNVLIFDEPITVLTPQKIDELMIALKELTDEGKSIILTTHELDKIKRMAGRCTVICRGQSIGIVNMKNVSSQQLADMMMSCSISFKTEKKSAQPKETILSIKDLVVKESRGLDAVKNFSLDVRVGEVAGIVGIDGSGQTELTQALAGLIKVENGSIHLNEEEVTDHEPREITEMGVAHVPEGRHKYGSVLEITLAEDVGLQAYYQKPYSSTGILNYRMINKHARELIGEYDVRTPSELVPVRALSGGNQQKAIIVREVDRGPDLLIVSQLACGPDAGTTEYIRRRLIEQRGKNKAVLLVSFELDEILNVSDRVTVIHAGEIVGIVDPKETTGNELGLLMAGCLLEETCAELSKVKASGTVE